MNGSPIMMSLLWTFAGLAVVFAGMSIYWWRQIRHMQKQILQMQAQQLQVNDTAINVGKRLVQVQQELQKLGSRIQLNTEGENEYKAYNQAARLLQQGVRLEDVVEKCHLTRGEAELLASMHRAAQGERPG